MQVEAAIAAQFQLLAQQKQFKVPEIHFSDYHWDTSRNSNVFSVYERMNDNDRSKRHVEIAGYGVCLPKQTVQFKNQTRYRVVEDEETQLDLAEVAIQRALENANLKN